MAPDWGDVRPGLGRLTVNERERVRSELAAIRLERREQFEMLRAFEHVKEFLDGK
jgi:hypothetical protein